MKSSGLSSKTMCAARSIWTSLPSGKTSTIFSAVARPRVSVAEPRTINTGHLISGRFSQRSGCLEPVLFRRCSRISRS